MKSISSWTILVVVFFAFFSHCFGATTFPISVDQAKRHVEQLPEVKPYLNQNPNLILELDRGPSKDDPYYYFWLGQKEMTPDRGTPTMNMYAVNATSGKVYYATTYKEVPGQKKASRLKRSAQQQQHK
jgi:hypothetical protein